MIEKPSVNCISEADLVSIIVRILTQLGGKAAKACVVELIYNECHEAFDHPYYQEAVSGGIPRWRHYIAWAKEQAKHSGLIKRPIQSGYGIWELTDQARQDAA
jgi:hypothetical protein